METTYVWATKKENGKKTALCAIGFNGDDITARAIARILIAEIRAKTGADEKTPESWKTPGFDVSKIHGDMADLGYSVRNMGPGKITGARVNAVLNVEKVS